MDIYHRVGTAAPSVQTSARAVAESAAPNPWLARSRAATPPREAEAGGKDNIPRVRGPERRCAGDDIFFE